MPTAFLFESMMETPLQSSTKDYARELLLPAPRSGPTPPSVGLAYPTWGNRSSHPTFYANDPPF